MRLADLTDKSFTDSVFPDACKLASVKAIFEIMARMQCNIYRLISLLPDIRKIMRKLLHERLNLFLKSQYCYHHVQFGLRINFFTNNAAMY